MTTDNIFSGAVGCRKAEPGDAPWDQASSEFTMEHKAFLCWISCLGPKWQPELCLYGLCAKNGFFSSGLQ